MRAPTPGPSEPLPGSIRATTEDEHKRAARRAHLQQAEADFDPLPFDAAAARSFGRVAASLRRDGRKIAAREYEAMIAATAIANDLPLYTCSPDDFQAIDDLNARPDTRSTVIVGTARRDSADSVTSTTCRRAPRRTSSLHLG